MFQERTNSHWITGVNRAAQFEKHMIVAVQGLGALDRELTVFDRFLVSNIDAIYAYPDEQAVAHAVQLTRHLTLSYLWVLGAYEVIRSIDQRFFAADRKALDTYEIRVAKHRFSRLRIPLAKYEAEGRSPGDSPIAYPVLNLQHGAAWQIAEDAVISREELGEVFLAMLERIPPRFEGPTLKPL
jgi:hypothetical protein